MLDLACGSGVKSFVLAQADRTVRVLAVDTPKVLTVTDHIAEAMRIADQVSYQSGDVLHMDLGVAFFLFKQPTPLRYDSHDLAQHKHLLASVFAGEAWEVPRLLEHMHFSS